MIKPRRTWRAVFGTALLAAAVAATLVVLPAAAKGPGGNRLDAKVVSTNLGPLTACSQDQSDCTPENNIVRNFIYVENGNLLTNLSASARAGLPDAFSVSSIDQAIFVDGVQVHDFDFVYTPPPDPSYPPYSGHWVSSASCPPEGPPCNVVGSPAVLPGEEASVFWTGWSHGNAEPNGTYIFKYTVHGTLNGTPVALSASSPPIVMTD
jgi:hypothetical protein